MQKKVRRSNDPFAKEDIDYFDRNIKQHSFEDDDEEDYERDEVED